jgi:hypothetical protein
MKKEVPGDSNDTQVSFESVVGGDEVRSDGGDGGDGGDELRPLATSADIEVWRSGDGEW